MKRIVIFVFAQVMIAVLVFSPCAMTTVSAESTTSRVHQTTKTVQSAPDSEDPLLIPAGTVMDPGDVTGHEEQYFMASEIKEGDSIYNRIYGRSYRDNDDISLEDLRYLKVLHLNFDGQTEVGEIIVNKAIADDTLAVFRTLYDEQYQIRKMHLVDDYWTTDGSAADESSMEDDNTSAFNYRTITNSDRLSNHAFGFAIDLNPLENPYILEKDDEASVSPDTKTAWQYTHRSQDLPHMIDQQDEAYHEFTQRGFIWGGDWNNPKDYQHFEKKADENASGVSSDAG